MKKVLLVSVMALVTGFSFGQALIPKVGVTLSNVSFSDNFPEEIDFDSKAKVGFTIGVGYQIPVTAVFSVQPELNFVQKGTKMELSYTMDFQDELLTLNAESKLTINYLELPVLAKFTWGGDTKFYFNIGPSVAYGLGGKVKSKSTATVGDESETASSSGKIKFGDAPDNYEGDDMYLDNRIDFGAQVGGGVLIANKIMLDLRYGTSFTDIFESSDDGYDKSKNNVLQFSIGVPLTF